LQEFCLKSIFADDITLMVFKYEWKNLLLYVERCYSPVNFASILIK
jgi:hypothetical protein